MPAAGGLQQPPERLALRLPAEQLRSRRPGDHPTRADAPLVVRPPSMTLGSRLRNSRIRSPGRGGHDAASGDRPGSPGRPDKEDSMSAPESTTLRHPPTRARAAPTRCPTMRRSRAVGARSRPQRPGLPRRPGRAEPLLGHRRHLPGGLPDHPRRRGPLRRPRPSATTCSGPSTRSPPPTACPTPSPTWSTPTTTPTTPAPPRCSTRRGPHRPRRDPAAAAARRRPGPAGSGGDLPGPLDPGDRWGADRAGLAWGQPFARQHRHPSARPRHPMLVDIVNPAGRRSTTPT